MPHLRLQSEMEFHDRQAAQRARDLGPSDYSFTDSQYLRHESWIAPAFDMLGDLRGKRVLDLGCGHGMASVVMARQGAEVVACDLSLGYVREANARAIANNVRTQLLICDGERLPFADHSFDRIWGNAILHHLDLRKAAPELARVLTPGGRAVFCEPWGGNRWLNWARQGLPYAGKERTMDEQPLQAKDLLQLRDSFAKLEIRGFQLFSMIGRVLKQHRFRAGLEWCDNFLINKHPAWQRYCRYVAIRVERNTNF
jgi:SAM-dependent methyltransferase